MYLHLFEFGDVAVSFREIAHSYVLEVFLAEGSEIKSYLFLSAAQNKLVAAKYERVSCVNATINCFTFLISSKDLSIFQISE